MKRLKTKAQMTLGDAPMIVLLVGLVFLIMATLAFIGQKYGAAMPSDNANSTLNETVTQAELAGNSYLDGAIKCNAEDFAIIGIVNSSSTGNVISSGNYTLTSTGQLKNITSKFTDSSWYVSYSFNHAGTSCTVNRDLETNISDNTSIAGIVLTISLVGIVLTVLISVFLGIRRTRI